MLRAVCVQALSLLAPATLWTAGLAVAEEVGEVVRTSYPVYVTCASEGLACATPFEITVRTKGVLKFQFIRSSRHCGSVMVEIRIDGQVRHRSPFFGYDGAEPSRTPVLDMGPVPAGEHELALLAKGRRGGCMEDRLASWAGTLAVWTTGAGPRRVVIVASERPGSRLEAVGLGESFRVRVEFDEGSEPAGDTWPVTVRSPGLGEAIEVVAERTEEPAVFLTGPIQVVSPEDRPDPADTE